METRKTIRITCEYNEEIDKAIDSLCEKIADKCIELDVVDNGQRTEWKARYEDEEVAK